MNNENTATGPDQAPDGKMLFYKQPELLNHQVHGLLGLRQSERPFEFAKDTNALPLTLGELPTAQKHFPIVFSDLENPTPLAVVGATDDINLFVDENGQWEQETYIPAYARCYPFALAARSADEFAVVIDRAADSISDEPEQPFFDGDKVTPETQSMIDFCGRYDAERKATMDFGLQLRELGLLVGQQVTRPTTTGGSDEPIASYVAVDTQKLNELEESVIKELFENGYLAAIFAHLFSLDNWQLLIERHLRGSADR